MSARAGQDYNWRVLFHGIDQLSGSRGSDEGRGMRALSALPSLFIISVPGMSSTFVWSAILMVEGCRCGARSVLSVRVLKIWSGTTVHLYLPPSPRKLVRNIDKAYLLITHRCQRQVQRRTCVGVPIEVEPFIQVGNFRDGDALRLVVTSVMTYLGAGHAYRASMV